MASAQDKWAQQEQASPPWQWIGGDGGYSLVKLHLFVALGYIPESTTKSLTTPMPRMLMA
uniref:Uncharacterized protein n=1 Tax=Aegilops tauschii TaxID=37682 RepID=M8CMU2_AEGTA